MYESVADFAVFMVDIQLTQAGFIFRDDVRPCYTAAFLWALPSTALCACCCLLRSIAHTGMRTCALRACQCLWAADGRCRALLF